MAYLPVAVTGGGVVWLSKTAGAIATDDTEFTARFAIKRNGIPASNEMIFRTPSNRFELFIRSADGRAQVTCRDGAQATVLNSWTFAPPGSLCDNAWHHVVMSRVGTGSTQVKVDGIATTMHVATNTAAATDFNANTASGILATETGGAIFAGDVADVWLHAGTGISLTTGEDDFADAAGRLKDLGASGVAEGMTPHVWLHRGTQGGDVTDWHTSDGSLGDVFTETGGSLSAAADAPLGQGPFYTQTAYRFYQDDGTTL